jgi:hypothetical protein
MSESGPKLEAQVIGNQPIVELTPVPQAATKGFDLLNFFLHFINSNN